MSDLERRKVVVVVSENDFNSSRLLEAGLNLGRTIVETFKIGINSMLFILSEPSPTNVTDHGAATIDCPLLIRAASPLPCIGWFAL